MEFADDGDVYHKIVRHQKNNTNFEEDYVWRVFIQVSLALGMFL